MVVIRCTQKLLKRMAAGSALRKPKVPTTDPASTTRLGDWFANLVQVGHQHLIVLAAEKTRLPIVVRAKDAKRLAAHLAEALPQVLNALGVPHAEIRRELHEMQEYVYAPTNNRSLVSTLNEFAFFLARHMQDDPEADLTEVALQLSEIPILVLEDGTDRLTQHAFGVVTRATRGPTRMYRLKVTLVDSKPEIWRRFEVPAGISLERLHMVLQAVMGWTNSHLHAFEKDGTIYDMQHPESEIESINEREAYLSEVLTNVGQSLDYEYDFGDGWQHRIVLEAVASTALVPAARVLEGRRACPPEDVGGLGGYELLLEALADPKHPSHRELKAWSGGTFDPEAYDVTAANARLARLKVRPRSAGPTDQWRLVH